MQSPAKGQLPNVWSTFSLQLCPVSLKPLKLRQLLHLDVCPNLLCNCADHFVWIAEFLWNLFLHIPAASSW